MQAMINVVKHMCMFERMQKSLHGDVVIAAGLCVQIHELLYSYKKLNCHAIMTAILGDYNW